MRNETNKRKRFMICVQCFSTGQNALEVCMDKDFLTGLPKFTTKTTPGRKDYKELNRSNKNVIFREVRPN